MRGKKLISLIISLSMILSMFSFQLVVSAEEAVEAVSEYQMEIDFLKKIGLIPADFAIGVDVTRGEMTKYVISAIYPDADFTVSEGVKQFADVPAGHAYYSYIKACKELGIVSGDSASNFNPDSVASVSEFLAIIINALGYTPYATAQGGYPSGYYVVAKNSGISESVNLSAATLKSDVAAKLLYNAIFADAVELKEISGDGITIGINGEKNFLSDRLGIYEYDAVVIDNGYSAIYGSSIEDEERVVIEETATGTQITAFVNDTDIADYLGIRVKVFIRNNVETGRYEIIYVAPHRKTNTLTISSSSILNEGLISSYVEYEKEKDALKASKINLVSAPKIITNGVASIGAKLNDSIPENGLLTFIDNDGNSKYEIINILDFDYVGGNGETLARNIVVDTVTTTEEEEYISCRFNGGMSLDLASDKNCYIMIGDGVKTLKDLKANDVISVAESANKVNGKTLYYLVVTRKTVAGVVEGKSDNGIFLNDGNEYELSTSILGVKTTYLNRIDFADITLYFDAVGNVAYTVGATKASKNYAYLINYDKKSSADEYVIAKILTKDGKIELMQLNSKVEIDGKVCDTAAEQLAALAERWGDTEKDYNGKGMPKYSDEDISSWSKGRAIIFSKNSDGFINKINTDMPDDLLVTKTNASEFYYRHTSIPYSQDEAEDDETLKAGWRNPGVVVIKTNKTPAGKFYVTSDTVIFGVPEIDRYGLQDGADKTPSYRYSGTIKEEFIVTSELDNIDDNYALLSPSDLKSVRYDMQAYDVDEDTGIAAMVVIRGRRDDGLAPEYDYRKPMAVCAKVTTVYNTAAEKNITKVYYVEEGVEKTGVIDLDECYYPYKDIITTLVPGDVIRASTDARGNLTHIERVMSIKNYNEGYSFMDYPSNLIMRYMQNSVGNHKAVFDSYIGNNFVYTQTYAIVKAKISNFTSTMAKIPVAAKTGGTLKDYQSAFNTIDYDDYTTYDELFVNLSSAKPTVVTIVNGAVRVKAGSLSDIKTIEQVGEEKASFVIMKLTDFAPSSVIIFNGLEDIDTLD